MGLCDELNKYIPKDFGKKKKKNGAAASVDDVARSSASEKLAVSPSRSTGGDQSRTQQTDHSDSVAPPEDNVPCQKTMTMQGHKKAVSAIAWDPRGDLLASGEHGAHLLLWDFRSMDQSMQSFRTVVPYEGQQTHAVKFSLDGTHMLCATGDPRAKLLTDEGRAVCEFKRGDQYVMDMRRTKGHVAALTALDWHPQDENRFVTSSNDSTLRFWDCERPNEQVQVIVAKTKTKAQRAVTTCAFAEDGKTVASAQLDGGVSVWATQGPFTRPKAHMTGAHVPGTETSYVGFVPGNETALVSRGGDGTVKLWDVRKTTEPVAEQSGLPSAGPEANVAFGPGGTMLVGLGSATATPSAYATVAVLGTSDLAVRRRIELPHANADVLSVHWHPRLNQVVAGLTSGDIVLMYDPEASSRGALLCSARRTSRYKSEASVRSVGPILTPHALPLFRDEESASRASAKRRREKMRADPVRSHKPAMPHRGHGSGGVIGVNETQHIMKTIMKDTTRDVDPREALLRYAAVAEADPRFVAPSYKGNKPVFDDSGMADEPEMKRRK
ncbi:hypothetical protein GGF46_002941 [Coemansia sp. RSA 552]|nr:hypothetical protein GGF46_002941 [Coemansia sp. RSA 552]